MTMYAIQDTRNGMYVEKATFGELGWQVKRTKTASKAKTYKNIHRANNASRYLGIEYKVVTL